MVNNIRKFRLEKEIRQEDLADAVGVSRQTIVAIEKGNYEPSLLLALKLSQYFKRNIEDLFKMK
ncbi:MAG: transcriptional regulator [Candidatus Doudnabacteria bacterium CG10_big_fil_rev_8_21_14_0_10_41_10]|uniref:Transcriptional regulator n=1 Tax=Candidatus Doudnabacteria bacterium CG10_big_fil_rev_8_21_14_0_10_41_10 TaxID=1974551 RepID=A0A2H0VH72_9BACT|nr:MAG: transcriptional regulator [Candidatus Doudnabacteria bacterium CG10_big_fil_rev_8_21_14_0_10_41_10]